MHGTVSQNSFVTYRGLPGACPQPGPPLGALTLTHVSAKRPFEEVSFSLDLLRIEYDVDSAGQCLTRVRGSGPKV